MTDEPMVERLEPEAPLTAEEMDADFDYLMTCLAGTTRGTRLVRIRDHFDALLSQLREQRERAERAERAFEGVAWAEMFVADECPAGKHADYAFDCENGASCPGCTIDAAERTVREQREALESIVKFSTDPLAAATARCALAALAPDTEEGSLLEAKEPKDE